MKLTSAANFKWYFKGLSKNVEWTLLSYILDRFISVLGVIGIIFFKFLTINVVLNFICEQCTPIQMLHVAASDLGLLCFAWVPVKWYKVIHGLWSPSMCLFTIHGL